MPATRRLTAILAADVAGYSRLMGADEEGTRERLKALRRELLDSKNFALAHASLAFLLAVEGGQMEAVNCAWAGVFEQ
jgi:class 3 adenylate cyclase